MTTQNTAQPSQTPARVLTFGTPARRPTTASPAARGTREAGPAPCAVCGKAPARLSLTRGRGHAPVRVCLACHHGVMRQRKMARAPLSRPAARRSPAVASGARAGLRSRPDAFLGMTATEREAVATETKYAEIDHRRRRAQIAARRALDLQPVAQPDLLDRAG